MEFWGLEVKPGQTVKYKPEDDHFLHLSQAALGESKKGSDSVLMYVKVDDQKLAVGTLSAERIPQIQFDLVFDKEFELSHTSKTASVFFSGYKVYQPAEGDEMDFDSEEVEDEEDEEKNIPVIKGNAEGKGKEQKSQVKIDAAASKLKAAKDVGKNKKDADDSDSDETDDSDSDEGFSPEEGDEDEMNNEDSSEDDEDDEEETPKKPETGRKRAAESVLKTPASDKKAKVATLSGQKTGDRKGVHVATPHPAKQASKTPGNNEKSPKSGGSVACKSCSKTFNSEMALQAHTKAKHGGK